MVVATAWEDEKAQGGGGSTGDQPVESPSRATRPPVMGFLQELFQQSGGL